MRRKTTFSPFSSTIRHLQAQIIGHDATMTSAKYANCFEMWLDSVMMSCIMVLDGLTLEARFLPLFDAISRLKNLLS